MFEVENQAIEEEFENGGQGVVVDAQETQDNPVDDGQEDLAGLQQGTEEETQTGAGESEQQGPGAADRAGQRRFQSHEDNAAARMARLRTEQELRRRYDDEVAGLGIPNPYTGRPFQSFEEFREYGKRYKETQQENEAKRQGRTVEDLQEEEADRAFVRKLRQEEAGKAEAARERQRQEAFMISDLQRFTAEHPGVDVEKLEKNEKFLRFAGKRLYREPLSELYNDFVAVVSDAEQAAVARAAGRSERSTGAGQGGSGVSLTPRQQAQLEAWNRENPEMKMTAKEFLNM